jgi:GNAT superfamily N-acetyltransferase
MQAIRSHRTRSTTMGLTWESAPDHTPHLRRLLLSDAPQAHALSKALGWGLGLADWERMIVWGGRGCFCIVKGDDLVAITLAIGYGRDRAWIGGVLTHPDHQRQGLATRVMTAALDYLKAQGVQRVLLDATPEGRPLYEKFGFHALYNVERWTGRASSYLGSRARPLTRDDLPAVIALDATIFGAARGRIIRRLVADSPRLAWVDEEDAQITGFLLAREPVDGLARIGPWMATSPWSAEKLLRTALSTLIGSSVRLDIPDRNTRATAFAHAADLRYDRHCTRMLLDYTRRKAAADSDPTGARIHQHYGVASLATG